MTMEAAAFDFQEREVNPTRKLICEREGGRVINTKTRVWLRPLFGSSFDRR